MANGTTRESLARADRMRERQEQDQKATRNALANLQRARGELPSYSDDSDSEVTGNFGPMKMGAKLGLPRPARIAVGVAIAFLLCCLGLAIVLQFWPR